VIARVDGAKSSVGRGKISSDRHFAGESLCAKANAKMQKQVRMSANKGKCKCDEVQVIERDERNRLLAAVKSPRTDISLESHCVQEAKEYKLLQRWVRSSFVTELICLG
jgi:hypothetical protein